MGRYCPTMLVRRVHEPGDFGRIAAMGSEVWGTISAGWRGLPNEGAGSADEIVVLVAESGERVISGAWLVFTSGTEFACLWGVSTVRAWRSRGIYRALIALRAHPACARGVRYLERGRLRRQQAHPAQAWLPGGHDHDSRRPDPQHLGMHGEAHSCAKSSRCPVTGGSPTVPCTSGSTPSRHTDEAQPWPRSAPNSPSSSAERGDDRKFISGVRLGAVADPPPPSVVDPL